MLKKILVFSLLGLILAEKRRFLFNTDQNPFPNSPFGGGGNGGVSSPFGSGSGGEGMGSPFGAGGVTGSRTVYSPCVPTHSLCTLQCVNGYVKGPGGCDFCMCNTNTQTFTTSGPAQTDPAKVLSSTAPVTQVSTNIPTSSENTTADTCLAAKLSCSSSCGDNGYLVDPSDCTFCLCKQALK